MIIAYFLVSAVVSLLCFELIKRPSISPSRASAGVSLFCFGALYLFNNLLGFDYDDFGFLILGASFVGMCSHKVVKSSEVFLSSIVYTAVYILLDPVGFGIGGGLGFVAFCSTVIIRVFSRTII